MTRKRIVRWCAGAIVAALAAGGCGSSGGGAPLSTSATPPGAAAILSFTVAPSVRCGAGPNAPVRVSYSVDAGRSQHVAVDGHVQKGTDAATRTLTVPVRCDGRKHSVALIVEGERGHLQGRTKYVTVSVPGA